MRLPVWSQGVDLIQPRPGPTAEAPNAAGSLPAPLPPAHVVLKRRKGGDPRGPQQMSQSPATRFSFIFY